MRESLKSTYNAYQDRNRALFGNTDPYKHIQSKNKEITCNNCGNKMEVISPGIKAHIFECPECGKERVIFKRNLK